jgi:hypothetical protein
MKVLMARIEPFDIETIKEDIDQVAEKFDRYLDTYMPRNKGISMYAMLGPVNHIIQKSAITLDLEELVGFGIRVHENKSYLPNNAKDLLFDAVSDFVDLMSGKKHDMNEVVPRVMKPRIIERIRYKIYFKRKTKFLDYLERRRQEFVEFLKSQFESIEDLNRRTGAEFPDWEKVNYPTESQLKKQTDKMKEICNEFLQKKAGGELIEDEGVE